MEDNTTEVFEFVLAIISIFCGITSLVLSSIVNHYTKIEKADETKAEHVLKITKLKHISGWNVAGISISLIGLIISLGLFINPILHKRLNGYPH